MQRVQYTERAPVYGAKGEIVTSSLIAHTAPPASHPTTKQVLLDTREDKVRLAYQPAAVDKEALLRSSQLSYEKKGDERLDTRSAAMMARPLPSIPIAPTIDAMPRAVSETEPNYVTVYEDGAHPFSPRTVGLLGTAARLPPPPAPTAELSAPAPVVQYTETTVTTTTVTTEPIQPQPVQPVQPIVAQPTVTKQPVVQAVAPVAAQPPAVVAVPSWPPTASEHAQAAAKRVVEASTVREESPLLVGVEKPPASPLLASVEPQPYELVHPKNAIDVVQLPPAQRRLPVPAPVDTTPQYSVPLPLAPPTEGEFAVAKRALVARPAPAPVAAKPPAPAAPAALAAPAPTVTKPIATQGPLPVPVIPTQPAPRQEQAQPKTQPQPQPQVQSKPQAQPARAPVPAPARRTAPAPARAPAKPWKMPRLMDVVLSPYAIGLYLLAAALALIKLPFWLVVGLAVALDVAVIAHIKKPARQPAQPALSKALVPVSGVVNHPVPQPQRPQQVPSSVPLPLLPPAVPTPAAVPALLPPQPETMSTALVPVSQPVCLVQPQAERQPLHARTSSRDAATQTEPVEIVAVSAKQAVAVEETEEIVPVPKSPAQFFASLRQQHGGSPGVSPVSDRSPRPVVLRKLAPSAKQQQAAQPLLVDVQSVAPAGLHLVDAQHDTTAVTAVVATTAVVTAAAAAGEATVPQRYVQGGSSYPLGTELPTPSRLPNPLLDALNAASPRRELVALTEAVETYHDMQPAAAMPPQVMEAARKAVATMPAAAAGAGVQGAANPVVMVPTWPPQQEQHAIAQARHVVEASTVRDHSALLDDADDEEEETTIAAVAIAEAEPFDVVPHAKVMTAPSFHVQAARPAPVAEIQQVARSTSPLPLTTQPLTAEEHAVRAVKQVTVEEKELVADVGAFDRVSDVGAGIVADGSQGGLRLRNIASHDHSQ